MDFQVANDKAAEYLPGFAAKYAKRGLERVYDRAFQTPLGRKLASLKMPRKYAIELLLYWLTELFEKRFEGNTALGRIVKEVVADAAPETAKRLINGAKREILSGLKTAPTEEKELAVLLLGLEDKDFIDLLNWLYENSISERRAVLRMLSLLLAEETARLMSLTNQEQRKFLSLFDRPGEVKQEIRRMTQEVRQFRQRFFRRGR